MSVLANNITVNSIGLANVGTATTDDNSTQIASYNYTFNTFFSKYILTFPSLTNIITGVKTFTNGFRTYGTAETSSLTTVGAVRASIVDILPSTTASLIIIGQSQVLSPFSGTGNNTYKNPIVVKDTNNKIQAGSITTTTPAGTSVAFRIPFSGTPLVFLTTNVVGTGENTGVFDVTPTGFKAVSNATGRVFWIAIGS
jgi:hypothetical protein